MAPVPDSSILTSITNLINRSTLASTPLLETRDKRSQKAADLETRATNIIRRDGTGLADPAAGVIAPGDINNNAIFALFALIGVAFVVGGIWFFFWAKNGGFYFKENDWDEYKSTVLRRKGPNGTTLTGATASTNLGGGSVVHGEKNNRSKWGRKKNKKGAASIVDSRYKDFEEEASTLNGSFDLGSEMSEVKWKAQQDKNNEKKKKKSRFGRDETRGLPDEEMAVGVQDTIRAYRHEKPARVGGLNKASDSSAFDGSTNDGSNADLLSNREGTPTRTPTKPKKERNDKFTGGNGGIRKVVSTSTPSAGASSFWTRATGSNSKKAEEEERIKAEAKKLQEKGRAAQRRDFSFQAGDDASSSGVGSSGIGGGDDERRARRERRRAERAEREAAQVPGGYYEESELGSELSGDIGTKSYHHPIPGLSSNGQSDYSEERRKKRNGGGYRRDAH